MNNFLPTLFTVVALYTGSKPLRSVILSNILFTKMSKAFIDETTCTHVKSFHTGASNTLFLITLYVLAKECIYLVDLTVRILMKFKNTFP